MAVAEKNDDVPEGLNKSFKQHSGVWMWDNSQPEMFANFKGRPSDIWVCSFPRSGTTLVQEMTYLVETLDFEGSATRPLDERFPFADVYNEDLPFYKDLKRGCGKIINVYRNPKAVVVSLFKLLKFLRTPMADSLEEFIEMFLEDKVYGSPWAAHVREFLDHRDDDNILVLRYEDIIEDKVSAIRKIASFLNRSLSSDDISKDDEHTNIENMRKNGMVNFAVQERVWKTDKSEGAFINAGTTHGWKYTIPPYLQAKIDSMVEENVGAADILFK